MKLSIATLTEWLGPEGAVAGLERSNLTNADLMMMARESTLPVDRKAGRRQLAIELVMSMEQRVAKMPDHLTEMSVDELRKYFSERMVSNRELLSLLSGLGISPPGSLRSKLSEFAAREISELGVFQRVAKGRSDKSPKP